MDWHGVCHSEGTSGNCGPECEAFLDGDCSIEDEIKEQCMEEINGEFKCSDVECMHFDEEDDDLLNCRKYQDPYKGCNIYRQLRKKFNKLKKETTDMNDKRNFNFDESTAQVKNNAMASFVTAKDVMVQLQQGKTVITVVKSALKKAPGAPDSLKLLLNTPYGDLVVGLILHTMAPLLTGSPIVMKAVKAANIAGAVEVSQQFTFIQDAIEGAISQIPGLEELKGLAKGKVEEVISADHQPTHTECPNCENLFKPEAMTHGLCRPCYNGLSNEEQAEMAGV